METVYWLELDGVVFEKLYFSSKELASSALIEIFNSNSYRDWSGYELGYTSLGFHLFNRQTKSWLEVGYAKVIY